jgi:FixJ family two-component response regulator
LLIRVSVNPTVLVVDDDPNSVTSWRKSSSHAKPDAHSRRRGNRRADPRDAVPDVLLVDVRLGAFNGLQLVAMAERPIPTIVMTGHDDVALRAAAERMGAEFLVKPIP